MWGAMTSAAVLQAVLEKIGSELCPNWKVWRSIFDRSITNLSLMCWQFWHILSIFPFDTGKLRLKWGVENEQNLALSLPEVTVGVDNPHSKALHSLLLSSDTFMTAKHAQGELVDPWLQHGSKLPLEIAGPVLLVISLPFAHPVGVQQSIRISCVVIIVSFHQGEESLCHITPLVCLRGWCSRWGCSLGTTPPSGEAEAAPASVPGCLQFVSRALTDSSLFICSSGGAGHFLHLKLSKAKVVY